MEYKSQNVICQNCKGNFKIEPNDFGFYEKIKVLPPTWCPECRMVRRMFFRNERSLYKQNCDLCKKSVISMYDPEQRYTVYCIDCYNSDDVYNSENIFACAGLRKKQYCIFNRQYTKKEYEKLLLEIKKHMDEMPYLDRKGRIYKYGEFFPIDITPFAYNESVVHEYFPLTKEEILERGYKYREPETKNYQPTILAHQLPDIKDADEKVLKEIIQCEHNSRCNHRCTTAFRIIQNELNIYKMLGVPLPNLCPNCRHMERIKFLNPPKLYHGKCMNKGCQNEFETSYAPDRPEIIYCDSCYKKEIY